MSPPAPGRYRTVFLSDLHLGCRRVEIAALTEFLAGCEIDHLYLVGDIIDGWKLEKRWHWTQDYCDLIDLLMTLRARRVRITLVTGNHDEKLRDLLPVVLRPLILRRYGIRIEERCIHRTGDGRRLIVMHGDQFDGLLWRGSSKLADRLWSWLTERGLVPPRRPLTLHRGRLRRWSLGRAIALERGPLAGRYAAAAMRRVVLDGEDGIVFGHSHVPLLVRRQGRVLANCGSWTGKTRAAGHTLVVERQDGELELLRWPGRPAASVTEVPESGRLRVRHPETAQIIRYIHALWRPGRPAPLRPVRADAPARATARREAGAPVPPAPAERTAPAG